MENQNSMGYQRACTIDQVVKPSKSIFKKSKPNEEEFQIASNTFTDNMLVCLDKTRGQNAWLSDLIIESYVSLNVVDNNTFVLSASVARQILFENKAYTFSKVIYCNYQYFIKIII